MAYDLQRHNIAIPLAVNSSLSPSKGCYCPRRRTPMDLRDPLARLAPRSAPKALLQDTPTGVPLRSPLRTPVAVRLPCGGRSAQRPDPRCFCPRGSGLWRGPWPGARRHRNWISGPQLGHPTPPGSRSGKLPPLPPADWGVSGPAPFRNRRDSARASPPAALPALRFRPPQRFASPRNQSLVAADQRRQPTTKAALGMTDPQLVRNAILSELRRLERPALICVDASKKARHAFLAVKPISPLAHRPGPTDGKARNAEIRGACGVGDPDRVSYRMPASRVCLWQGAMRCWAKFGPPRLGVPRGGCCLAMAPCRP